MPDLTGSLQPSDFRRSRFLHHLCTSHASYSESISLGGGGLMQNSDATQAVNPQLMQDAEEARLIRRMQLMLNMVMQWHCAGWIVDHR